MLSTGHASPPQPWGCWVSRRLGAFQVRAAMTTHAPLIQESGCHSALALTPADHVKAGRRSPLSLTPTSHPLHDTSPPWPMAHYRQSLWVSTFVSPGTVPFTVDSASVSLPHSSPPCPEGVHIPWGGGRGWDLAFGPHTLTCVSFARFGAGRERCPSDCSYLLPSPIVSAFDRFKMIGGGISATLC